MAEPWDLSNCPATVTDREAWSARCREWCHALARNHPEQTLGTGGCDQCGFRFITTTSNYSFRSSADVYNYGTCCNPDCRHTWQDYS